MALIDKETIRTEIERRLSNIVTGLDFTAEIELKGLLEFLDSLLEQPVWKPSPEQMEALSDACVEASTFKMGDILESLYNDLKRL